MNFENSRYFRIYFSDYLFISINDTLVSTWAIGAALIVLAVIVRLKIKNFKEIPETKFQNIMEAIVEIFNNHVTGIMTKKYSQFGSWFFGVFMFLLLSNIIGITGLRNPTADLAVPFALALTTVFLMQYIGIKYNGVQHFKDWLSPIFLFAPLNILSDLVKSVSLSMRLFINILSGLILMHIIYYMLPWFASIGPPGLFSLFFDVAIGALQAYLFVTLSMFFLMMKVPKED